MERQFLDAVFTNGIQHPNFFNGRILTATDLQDEQAANLQRSRYLGQAIGSGVVHGLTVIAASDRTALEITTGLAINPRGDGLFLPNTTTVELVLTERSTNSDSPFEPCDIEGTTTLTGKIRAGYYLLVITNATRLSVAMVPNSGIGGDRTGCTNRYEELGVQFKLVPLTNNSFAKLDLLSQNADGTVRVINPEADNSRSRLAHLCLGTHQLATFARDPSKPSAQYGLVDALYGAQQLTNCDVPLAIFRFQRPRVQFVDMWAVRRPYQPGVRQQVAGPVTLSNSDPIDPFVDYIFNTFVSARRVLESGAFLLQFQAHLRDIDAQIRDDIRSPSGQSLATKYFEYLPAAGYLPIPEGRTSTAEIVDFVRRFFGSASPIAAADSLSVIDPEFLRRPFRESFYEKPIDPNTETVKVYRVDEQPYVVFFRNLEVIPEPPIINRTITRINPKLER